MEQGMDWELMDKWLEIDLSKIGQNLQAIRSNLPLGVRLIAVIKAEAYGHGAIETARLLCARGVDFLAVTYLEEALALKEAEIDAQIMIFSPLTTAEQYEIALEQDITLTITSLPESLELDRISRRAGRPGKVHLKIDTGLSRFGLTAIEALQVCQVLAENPFIQIEGIYIINKGYCMGITHGNRGYAKNGTCHLQGMVDAGITGVFYRNQSWFQDGGAQVGSYHRDLAINDRQLQMLDAT